MNLSTHDIAKEIKAYFSLKSFSEDFVSKLAAHLKLVDFKVGEVILKAGQSNGRLYFLRSGTVEILFQGEKVAEIFKPGESFGQLTSLSQRPSSTELRTQTAVQCFCFSGSDFSSDPKQELLLTRLYAVLLSERMIDLFEKAKLYEVTARELVLKKRELETYSAAQMNFLRGVTPALRKKVLIVEPSKKQQNIVKAAVAGAGVDLFVATTVSEAQKIYSECSLDLIFCESSLTDFLFWSQQQAFQGESVLVESGEIDFNRLATLPFVQNVISRNPEDRIATAKSFLTTLSKILQSDYFGIEKYLAWGTEIQTVTLKSSVEREQIKKQMADYFYALGIRPPVSDRVQQASEEMMMNAIYDAPVDSQGTSLFNHLPRTTEIQLHPGQQPQFRFGCDGNFLAISVRDPFGALPRYVIINYLESCYANQAGHFNLAKGGAGRGLHQILESCDWTIFNIKPGQSTEVIGLFDLVHKSSGLPQFHYFFLK